MRRDHSTVPLFPRISAEILDEVTARVTVSGIASSVTGTDLNATRAEVVRLISLTAKRLGRPVRALTVEGGEEWPLVVYPDGVVESDTTVEPGKRKGRKRQAGRTSKARGAAAPRGTEGAPAPGGPPAADMSVPGEAPPGPTVEPRQRPLAPETQASPGPEPAPPRPAAPSLFEMVVQSLEERDRALSAGQNRNPTAEPRPTGPPEGTARPSAEPPAPAHLPVPGFSAPGSGTAADGRGDSPGRPAHARSGPSPESVSQPPVAPPHGVPAASPPAAFTPSVPPSFAPGSGPEPESEHVGAALPVPPESVPQLPAAPPHGVPSGPLSAPPVYAPQPPPGYAHGTPSYGAPTTQPPVVPAPLPRPGLRGGQPREGGPPATLTGPSESAELWNTVIHEINSERGTHTTAEPPVRPLPDPGVAPPAPSPPKPSRRRRFGFGGLLGLRVPEWSAPPENFHARMQVPIAGHRRVAVLSLKGGVGKTTTSVLLGSLMAAQRESRVVAVDVNRDMGTLRDRVPLQTGLTVRDLFHNAGSISGFTDLRGYVSSNEERMHALVGDGVFGFRELDGQGGYSVVAGLLERYYDIVLNDCGTGMGNPGMRQVLDLADQVVVVLEPASDSVRAAESTFEWLRRNGHADLVAGAVVVISKVERKSASSPETEALEAHFSGMVRAVVRIPFDEHLSWGRVIRFQELHESTRNACAHMALLSVEGLAHM